MIPQLPSRATCSFLVVLIFRLRKLSLNFRDNMDLKITVRYLISRDSRKKWVTPSKPTTPFRLRDATTYRSPSCSLQWTSVRQARPIVYPRIPIIGLWPDVGLNITDSSNSVALRKIELSRYVRKRGVLTTRSRFQSQDSQNAFRKIMAD